MDNISELVQAHINIGRLQKELNKCRRNLIREHANNKHNTYISKISYNGFIQQLKKETIKFEKLLENSDTMSLNNEIAEMIENIQSDTESTTSDRQFISEYNSVPMTDNTSISINRNEIQKPVKKYKKTVQMTEEKKSEIKTTNVSTKNRKQRRKMQKTLRNKNKNNNQKVVKPIKPMAINYIKPAQVTKPMRVVNNVESVKVKKVKKVTNQTNKYNKTKPNYTKSVKTGFEIYKNKPIYCSTLLRCNEMCGKRKNDLKQYLIKYGDFNKLKIEKIIFRYKDALIAVRGPLNIINQCIYRLNNKKGDMFGEVIELFETTQKYYGNNSVSPSKVLYVNNFDILNKECHKKLTKLFGSFGELKENIFIGLDKVYNPFAIVKFKYLKEAKECVYTKPIAFDGKVLSINFSKY